MAFLYPRALLSIVLSLDCFEHWAESCTTVGVGRAASSNHAVLLSQSNDGDGTTDTRVFHVPARSYRLGAVRPIFPWNGNRWPRYIGSERGKGNYVPIGDQKPTEAIGEIPQVASTYSYIDGAFGLLNDHGVAIAESTCSSKAKGAWNVPRPQGNGLFFTDELSRIAMERCSTARCALSLMGDLATQHGFYGDGSWEGTGESLLVSDASPGELWIFHVLATASNNGSSAIWAAQKVPDDHVTVVANMFVLRSIPLNITPDCNQPDVDVCGSPSMFEEATKMGWWTPSVAFDFTKVFSDGEYSHKYYSGRRMWRALKLLTPTASANAGLSMSYNSLLDDAPYPISLPLIGNDLIGLEEVAATMRDFLAGSLVDPTTSLASGAWGVPNRYGAGRGEEIVHGAWERTISIYRTDYAYVAESRVFPRSKSMVNIGPTIWLGPHAAHASVWVPMFPATFSLAEGASSVNPRYSHGQKAARDKKRWTALWAHRSLANLLDIKFSHMYRDMQVAQSKLEAEGRSLQANLTRAMQSGQLGLAKAAEIIVNFQDHAVSTWWDLGDELLFRWADGAHNVGPQQLGECGTSSDTGYDAWWLAAVDYSSGPVFADNNVRVVYT